MRDWTAWHDDYLDPSSELSRRLDVVQRAIRDWADGSAPGPLRVLSLCAGQAHDIAGALADHPRRDDLSGTLVELDPANAAAARSALRDAGLTAVRTVVGDAGSSSSFRTALPVDLVLV